MEEFSAIAAREKVDINMVSTETTTSGTRITQTQSFNPRSGRSNKLRCKKCNRDVNENYIHCDTCQRCRPGSVCWACEPEKAPDSWPGKRDALRKKQISIPPPHLSTRTQVLEPLLPQ